MIAGATYSAYSETGVECIGGIPSSWEMTKLKLLVKEHRQITYGIVQAGPNVEGGIPYIRPADMSDEGGVADFSGLLCTSEEIASSFQRSSIDTGELVCSIGPSFGKVMVVPEELRGGNLTQGTARVAISPANHARFYFWALRSPSALQQWESSVGGATFRALNLRPLSETQLPRPSLNEQIQIARFLDYETAKIDALIEKQQQLIALLKEKREAVISHAVTKGLNPEAPMRDSGVEWLGEVPAHWEVRRLSHECDFQSGKAHEPFVDDDGEFICVNSRFVSTQGLKRKLCTENLTPAQVNDVLMVMSDLPNGRALARAFFVDDNSPYAVNQRVCIVRARKTNPRFIYYLLDRSQHFLRQDDGVNQTHLSNSTFKKCPVLVPPLTEQMAIADHLEQMARTMDDLIDGAGALVTLLQERRSALISAAVTGKIDVRGWKAPASESEVVVA